MKKFLATAIGRFRLLAFFEGLSLIILVFLGMPLKYYFNQPFIVEYVGPIHGALFVLFILYAVQVSIEQKWSFWSTSWKVLLSSFVPFGTFYVDHKILAPICNVFST
jgi:integral membrane protein